MKTIFNNQVQDELIARINLLTPNHKGQWGKMNILQMAKHNTYWNGWVLGKDNPTYKQSFIGKLLGKSVLKKMIKNEKYFDKNIPTSDQFKIADAEGDLEEEKLKWNILFEQYNGFDNKAFVHDFFGKMTREQIGILVYKHTDHHLRQFGA